MRESHSRYFAIAIPKHSSSLTLFWYSCTNELYRIILTTSASSGRIFASVVIVFTSFLRASCCSALNTGISPQGEWVTPVRRLEGERPQSNGVVTESEPCASAL